MTLYRITDRWWLDQTVKNLIAFRNRKFIACHSKPSVLNNAFVLWCAKKVICGSSWVPIKNYRIVALHFIALQYTNNLRNYYEVKLKEKASVNDLEDQFPVPRYTAASKIGNSVISLLWQLQCRCNPDHNKFSSLSNTTVVAIFPKLCFWRRILCSNLGGIDPEKLYRVTLKHMEVHKLMSQWFWDIWEPSSVLGTQIQQ